MTKQSRRGKNQSEREIGPKSPKKGKSRKNGTSWGTQRLNKKGEKNRGGNQDHSEGRMSGLEELREIRERGIIWGNTGKIPLTK